MSVGVEVEEGNGIKEMRVFHCRVVIIALNVEK